MTREEYISFNLERLDSTLKQYKAKELDELGKRIITLLQGIVVVESEQVTAISIYNQLKESYFGSDLATSNFIANIYEGNKETLDTYMDIYLEQVFSDEVDNAKRQSKIDRMRNLLMSIDPNLVTSFNEKIRTYQSENKL